MANPNEGKKKLKTAERLKKIEDTKKLAYDKSFGKETGHAAFDVKRSATKTVKKAASEETGEDWSGQRHAAGNIMDGGRLIALASDSSVRHKMEAKAADMAKNYGAADSFQSWATRAEHITFGEYADFIEKRDGAAAADRFRVKHVKDVAGGKYVDPKLEMKLRSYASMNIVEEFARANLDYKRPDGTSLFTKPEKELLKTNNEIFKFRSGADIHRAVGIFQKLQAEFGGQYANLDATKVTEKDFKAIFGKAAGDTLPEQLSLAGSRIGADARAYEKIGKDRYYSASDIVLQHTAGKVDDAEAVQGYYSVAKFTKKANRYRLGAGGLVVNIYKGASFAVMYAGNKAASGIAYLFNKRGKQKWVGVAVKGKLKFIRKIEKTGVPKLADNTKKAVKEIWRKPVTGTVKWGTKAAVGTANLAGKAVYSAGSAIGRAGWRFGKSRFGGTKAFGLYDKIFVKTGNAAKKLKTTKESVANISVNAKMKVGDFFKKTKDLLKYNPVSNAINSAVSVITAPARLVEKIYKKVLLAGGILLGGVLLSIVLIEGVIEPAVSTLSSAVSVFVINDVPYHFNNANGTTPLFEVESDGFQQVYNSKESEYLSKIEERINGESQQVRNLKGEFIPYGVEGTQNNGITFTADSAVTSNLEDILTVMAMMLTQQQQKYHTEANELVGLLFDASHVYEVAEGSLYPCEKDECETVTYYCNESVPGPEDDADTFIPYASSDLHCLFEPHDTDGDGTNDYDPESDSSIYIKSMDDVTVHTCPVCGSTGCVQKTDRNGNKVICYHDDDASGCDNYETEEREDPNGHKHGDECYDENAKLICNKEESESESVRVCKGHACYECPGHEAKVCFGHVDAEVEMHQMTFDEMCTLGQDAIDKYRTEKASKEAHEQAQEEQRQKEHQPGGLAH